VPFVPTTMHMELDAQAKPPTTVKYGPVGEGIDSMRQCVPFQTSDSNLPVPESVAPTAMHLLTAGQATPFRATSGFEEVGVG
jgi:hypothetical protein